MKDYNPCRRFLVGLVNSIDSEIGLEEEIAELILHELGTWEKILGFNAWVKSKMVKGKLQATETEVCRAAVQIAKAYDRGAKDGVS